MNYDVGKKLSCRVLISTEPVGRDTKSWNLFLVELLLLLYDLWKSISDLQCIMLSSLGNITLEAIGIVLREVTLTFLQVRKFFCQMIQSTWTNSSSKFAHRFDQIYSKHRLNFLLRCNLRIPKHEFSKFESSRVSIFIMQYLQLWISLINFRSLPACPFSMITGKQ